MRAELRNVSAEVAADKTRALYVSQVVRETPEVRAPRTHQYSCELQGPLQVEVSMPRSLPGCETTAAKAPSDSCDTLLWQG